MRTFLCILVCLLGFSRAYSQTIAATSFNSNSAIYISNEKNLFYYYSLYNEPADEIEPQGATAICPGGNVVLKAKASGASSYQWKKDGSDIGGATSQDYTATAAGNYSVVINGTTELAAVTVTVKPIPVAGFTFTPNNQCAGTPVTFTNTSNGTGLTYQWSFSDPNSGGNNASTTTNPQHTFVGNSGAGTQSFNVKLTATSSDGCSNESIQAVTVKQAPDAQLGGDEFDIVGGKPYFKVCNSVASTLTFYNESATQATNTNYTINWGDGSAVFSAANFSSLTHTYSIGPHTLTFTVTGSNGCVKTSTYSVFVGSNPAVGLGNPGNTVVCSGTSLTFPISGTTNNPPGTMYSVLFNDGTPAKEFTHPAPLEVSNTFNSGSCGKISGAFANSFSASITATNPCGTSAATVVPIYVSQKPKASFTVSPKETVCANTTVTFTNTSINGNNINSSGECTDGKLIWSISPASGWNLNSGTLGDDKGSDNPVRWNPGGSNSIGVQFTSPGTYTIKLKVGGNALCGSDFIEKTICVNPAPVAAFALDKTVGCGPLTVKATNNSNLPNCGSNTYKWTVDYSNAQGCTPNISAYSFINGTNDASADPEFQFTNPGVYTINLVTRNSDGACVSSMVSRQVTVKAKPNVSLSALGTLCQNGTISPSATVNNCYSSSAASYQWSFPGGTPSASNLADPGTIRYNVVGTYTITLDVTNECGTTTKTQTVTVKPAPDVTVPPNLSMCAGNTTGSLSFGSSFPGTTYTWTNDKTSIGLGSNGSGSISSFTTTNASSSPVTANIVVTPTLNSCSGPSGTFTITVNPIPSAPVVTSSVAYCQGESVVPLTAAGNEGYTLLWYTNASLGVGSATAPTPSTSASGTTTHYVSQKSPEGCESSRSAITVTVKAVPNISGSKTDATSCGSSSGSIIVTGLQTGTIYTVSYTKGGSVTTQSLTAAGGQIVIMNLASGTYTDIFVTTNGCPSNKVGPFTISDPNPPAVPVISSIAPLCSGSEIRLNLTSPVAGVTYTWTSPDGVTTTGTSLVRSNATVGYSGTYSVTATKDGCSSAAATTSIVVNQTPATPIITTNSPVCSGAILTLGATTSTPGVSYAWSGPNSFTSSDQNQSFSPATTSLTGTYKVIATLGSCSSENTKDITVNLTPDITGFSKEDPTACNTTTGKILLNGLSSGTTYSVSYSKDGVAVPATNLAANPSGTVTIDGLKAGVYTNIKLTVNSCTSNTVGPITLQDPNPPAAPVLGSNIAICSGETLRLTAGTPQSSATFAWSGPNSFTSSLQNPEVSNVTTAANGTYTAVITVKGCTASASVDVTVNPKPASPVVIPAVTYCLNAAATPLVATGAAGNTLQWFDQSGVSLGTTPPTPSTGAAGTVSYFVSQKTAATCESDRVEIKVTVYPVITGNAIGDDQPLCSGKTPGVLAGKTPLGGGTGTYSYQWQVSTDNGATWNNIVGATSASYQPGAIISDTKFRRLVTSGPCTLDASNVVTITTQTGLTNYEISASQTICESTAPEKLIGQLPAGGSGTYSYQWEQSSDNSKWDPVPGSNTIDLAPPALSVTTYYKRKVIGGACEVYSSAIKITVNERPVISPIADAIYCNTTPIAAQVITSTPTSGVTYTWTNDNVDIGLAASGSGTVPAFIATNSTIVKSPVSGKIDITPTYTSNSVGCTGNVHSYRITVLPTITIKPFTDEVECTGTTLAVKTPVHDAASIAGSAITYKRTVTGEGINLTSGTDSNIPGYVTFNDGTTDKVATITITPVYTYGGKSCEGTPVSYTVTVKPKTPDAAAGPDVKLCAATSYTMQALAPAGTTGKWEQVMGPSATIVDPSSPSSQITGLQPGKIYRFKWTLSGFSSCPPTSAEVQIEVLTALSNTIDVAEQTICSGITVQVNGNAALGGSGIYAYQWQMSTDGSTWTDISGATGVNLTFTPDRNVEVRRKVVSGPCISESPSARINVQLPVSNNTIAMDQRICINTDPSILKGSDPSGADGSFLYQWQESTDGVTWKDIPAATSRDFDPPVLTVTTQYQRIVTTSLCSGPQSSTSNVVTIIVNPDAKAEFTQTKDQACAPFVLHNAVIRLTEYPDRNTTYEWYVDNVLIGTGATFPGYTITSPGQTITLKLKAISLFGCKDATLEHTFSTIKEPAPAFTQSTAAGCGPLTVNFANTTPEAGLFIYQWDFGNGQQSSSLQPGAVTFAPNPSYGDTTYFITLKASSVCTTITTTKTVLVKSGPKALFTPDKSIGCSPMTVTFSNTSFGVGNSYTWDFGDGTVETSAKKEAISHTFITGVRDTFYVKLKAANECGQDEQVYAIVVTPNTIRLDFAVNGNEHLGCAPHPVRFINNTSGATVFRWDFGDGNVLSTSKNIDTVTHAYLTPGTYMVRLIASNGCSDTTTTETITVFSKPVPAFSTSQPTVCIGEAVRFTNGSADATSYLWKFGDGAVSTETSPSHNYTTPGLYTVVLVTFKASAPGVVCSDSVQQQVQVVSTLPGDFEASAQTGKCLPLTIQFTNRYQPSVTAAWDFGDGTTGSGDVVSHTYTKPGSYTVRLTTTVPGGCTYTAAKTIQANGPYGELTYTGGRLCNDQPARLEAAIINTDQLVWDFGDGTQLTTTDRVVFHRYTQAGKFIPSVSLVSNSGCTYPLKGLDTLYVDKITAGFQYIDEKVCGSTALHFSDTSHVFFGKKTIAWDFGDGTTGNGSAPIHSYAASGNYKVQMTVTGVSGCVETVTRSITVEVYDKPTADIVIHSKPCTNQVLEFKANIASIDPVTHIQWLLSNGVKGIGNPFTTTFTTPGNYSIQVIVGTVNGCFDTATASFRVDPSPVVVASGDVTLCRGGSTNLTASGANSYSWSPLSGLSCTTCATPRATPLATTPYVVTGTNSFGCADADTVVVTVIQPFKMQVSPNDSICIGSSTLLQASGATTYSWSPAAGLSSTIAPNPVANPTVTTKYRVVGYDGYNCFTDTAFVVVAIGQYPTIELGPDLTLSTGTLHPLSSTVQNGPIRTWEWKPATDLSCANCPQPIAHIKKDIIYTVKATTPYGCSDTDTLSIKTFCESAQVFIPNAFTPDGDGINDIAMVRGKGIVSVKTFRIFNRWGEVVFERSSFQPNEARYGWDGKIRGVIGGPDVFVYTAEVICENGTTYTYKGNISIIK